MIRYRFALTLGVVPNDPAAIQGFTSRSLDEQSQMVLQKLLELDQGTPAPMTAPVAAPTMVRQPDMGGQPPPQQMGAPGPQQPMNGGPPPGFMPPPQQQFQPPAPQTHPVYPPQGYQQQPVQGSPPSQQFQQPPPQQFQQPPMQMQPQQPQQLTRTPSTPTDPGGVAQQNFSAAEAGSAVAMNDLTSRALTNIIGLINKLTTIVNDEVAGNGDLQELHDLCLGLAAQQQLNSVMLFMIYETMNQGIPRESLAAFIREEVRKDPVSPILAGLKKESTAGKG